MKWLLVTTNPLPFSPNSAHPNGAGWNVGDLFALEGVKQLVREVDSSAEIELLNMDVAESITTERPFDRAIFAGRPMFWRQAPIHPLWVHLLDGWLCRDPRKVLALGVGDCFPCGDDLLEFSGQLHAARKRVWRLVLRSRRVGPDHGVDRSVCPAAWALLDRPEKPHLRLCNFMRGGGHYPEFNRRESELWDSWAIAFARILREEGFQFVAHSDDEVKLSSDLGFGYSYGASTVEDFLDLYAGAERYIGNRMHGAIVLAGRRATAVAIGFDSRLEAVNAAGHTALFPHSMSPYILRALARREPDPVDAFRVVGIRNERARMLELVKHFAS